MEPEVGPEALERFERLVRQHQDAIYRGMLRVCHNAEDAEDVLADSFLKAWQHLGQLRDDGSFRSWLLQIGRRVCWRLRSRADLNLLELLQEPEAAGPSPEQLASMEQLKSAMQSLLATMPLKLREAYEMGEQLDLKGEEAAQKLGVKLATYKSRLLRAKQMVRERMNGEVWKSE